MQRRLLGVVVTALLLMMVGCTAEGPTPAGIARSSDTTSPTPAPTPTATAARTTEPSPTSGFKVVEDGEGGQLTRAEAEEIKNIMAGRSVAWGITPDMIVQVAKGKDDRWYFTPLQGEQTIGKIIFQLQAGEDVWVVAELDGAVAKDPAASRIEVEYDGQVVAKDSSGETVLLFQPPSGWSRPLGPETSVPTETPRARQMTALREFDLYLGPGESYGTAWEKYRYVNRQQGLHSVMNATAGVVISRQKIITRFSNPQDNEDWLWVDFSNELGSYVIGAQFWVKASDFDLSQLELEDISVQRSAPPTPERTATPGTPTAVAKQNANLRGGPGTEYAVVGGLKAGDTVRITGRSSNGQWLQVERNGRTAWVSVGLVNASGVDKVAVITAPPPPTRQPEQPTPPEPVGDRKYVL